MSPKILIALQFWKGDKQAAEKVASFLADLEAGHSNLADFLFVHRFDCEPPDKGVVEKVSRKFNTHVYQSPQRGVNWPDGCAALWFGTMEWIYSFKEARKIEDYKAIFTCEADGAPIFRDWVARMSAAWDFTQSGNKKVYIAGPLVSGNGVEEHVNGNCLVSGDMKFLHWITRRVAGVPSRVGWDYALRGAFKQWGWANIPGMVSLYNTPHFTPEEYMQMVKNEYIWVHGDKSNCLVDMGRSRLML